jgi:starvation-inducible DNA-binding protein
VGWGRVCRNLRVASDLQRYVDTKERTMVSYTVPGLSDEQSTQVIGTLQERLSAYNDLHLTLKHVHWNVVGPSFISVHEMIDPQVEVVRGYADEVAERIATMGGSPKGTVGAIAADRTWDDYSIGRDTALAHLGALDLVYVGVVEDNRKAIEMAGEIDPVTEDMLIGQTAELEKFQWFVRAHLEDMGGSLANAGATTEEDAAEASR